MAISHEWIYQYIYRDKRAEGTLYRSLRCQKARRKRYGTYSRRGRIANQVSIEQRPAVVNTRQRIGDWEGDTIIGKGHCGAFVTLVERKSKYTVAHVVPQKTITAVRAAKIFHPATDQQDGYGKHHTAVAQEQDPFAAERTAHQRRQE